MEAAAKCGTPVVGIDPGQSFTGRYALRPRDRLTAKMDRPTSPWNCETGPARFPPRIFRDSRPHRDQLRTW